MCRKDREKEEDSQRMRCGSGMVKDYTHKLRDLDEGGRKPPLAMRPGETRWAGTCGTLCVAVAQ